MIEPAPDAETEIFLREFAALAAQAPPGEPSLAERRAALEAMAAAYGPDPAPVGEILKTRIPGPAGPIPLRIYRPKGADAGPRPLVLHLHGGGWALGGPTAYERICRAYCALGDCIVVDVDYRLAPEHKFPAALEDCEAALDWTAANAEALGGDPRRLVVAGDSAGGALAASVCLRTRHRVALQVLVYPVMTAQPGADFASRRELGNGRFFLREFDISRAQQEYLSDPNQGDDPAVSPLAAQDKALIGQPPTLFVVAGLDPLRDEAELYARRLRDQGVAVEFAMVEGVIHAFVLFAGAFRQGREAIAVIASRIRELKPA